MSSSSLVAAAAVVVASSSSCGRRSLRFSHSVVSRVYNTFLIRVHLSLVARADASSCASGPSPSLARHFFSLPPVFKHGAVSARGYNTEACGGVARRRCRKLFSLNGKGSRRRIPPSSPSSSSIVPGGTPAHRYKVSAPIHLTATLRSGVRACERGGGRERRREERSGVRLCESR